MSSSALQVSRRTVTATVARVGFHSWPAAPARVGYLASPHRHLFTIRAEFDVTHADRDVEFHIAQGWLDAAVRELYPQEQDRGEYAFGHSSCEHIAQAVAEALPHRPRAVEVWEDMENGARVEFLP